MNMRPCWTLLPALLLLPLQIAPAQDTSSIDLHVLTYNVWMVPIQGKRSTDRAKMIGSGLRGYDLVFIQEAFGDSSKKRILSCAGRGFKSRYAQEKEKLLDSGEVTVSRNCITKSCFRRFSSCRGPQCFSDRGILYTQIQLPNGVLVDTFNVHLQAMEPDADVRMAQLCDLRKVINCYNDGCNPVIIAGDFNVIGENPEYYCLLEKLSDFRDVWTEVNAGCPGYSWDPVKNDWGDPDHDESRKRQRLDYLFIRDGSCAAWSVQCAQVAFNSKRKTGKKRLFKEDCIFPSDHFGVGARLSLSPTLGPMMPLEPSHELELSVDETTHTNAADLASSSLPVDEEDASEVELEIKPEINADSEADVESANATEAESGS